MDRWLQDLRYAVRILRARPAHAVTAILTLALGIGGTTAVFSLVNAVLVRPLPFGDPDRIVMVWENAAESGFPKNEASPRDYTAWASQAAGLERIAATESRSFTLTGGHEPEKLQARAVSPAFFAVLGVAPALGRAFRDEEGLPGADKVVVLSDGLWRRRFGADRDILGRPMVLDGEKYIVIGVMPRGFQFLESYVGLWVPLALGPDEVTSDAHYLAVVARLGHGVSLIRAQADLDTITRRTSLDAAAGTRPPNTYLVPLEDELVGHARRGLLVLLAAVASVLLIGCANLASLLLARAASRGREFAVRAALGAGRSRIVTQLLMESALLAVLGVAPALLVASATLAFLEPLVPAGVALSADPSIDLAALGFMAALAVLSVVVFGLAPALHITRLVSGPGLQQRGAGHGDVGTSRARSALVVGEVAITLLLLVGASLLIQTLYHLRYANLGLRPEGVLTLRTSLPFEKYGERARRVAFYDEVLERVSHLPGVLSAGYTTSVPLEWQGGTTGIVVEGHPRDPTVTYEANHRQVSAGYFQTIGVPLLNGRFFDGTDSEQSQRVAMVNQTMARQYWPGEDAVGRRFTIGKPASPSAWLTIVGIVGDVRQMGLEAPVKAEMYFPYHQVQGYQWFGPRDLVVRTSGGDPIGWAGAVAREVHAVDPDEAVANVRTLEAILDEHVAEPRLAAALLVAFAGLALVLASVGIYGMLSFFVAEHLPEIGVRVALGADKSDIVRLIVGKGLVLTLAGASFGAIGALAMTRVLSSQLYGVGEHDPLAFIGAAIAVLAVAVVASYFPARRAAGLDPVVALRAE